MPKQVKYDLSPELEGIIQKMIDAGESQEDMHHVIAKYEDAHDSTVTQTLKELKGAFTHIPQGMWNLAKDMVYDLPVQLYDTLFGPDTYADKGKAFLDSIVNAPKEYRDKFLDATHEERGQMMGDLAGNIIAGKAAATYGPGSVKSVARPLGRGMEIAGKQPGLRWAGAGMATTGAYTGNIPAVAGGLALAAAPKVVETGGRALKNWAEADPTYLRKQAMSVGKAPLKLNTKQQAEAIGTLQTELGKSGEDINAKALKTAKGDLSSVDKAIAEAKKEAGGSRTAAAREETSARRVEDRADVEMSKAEQKAALAEEKDRVLKEKAATIEAARAGMEPGKPSFSKSMSAPTPEGGTQTMRQGFKSPEEETTVEQELAKLKVRGSEFAPGKPAIKAPPMEGVPEAPFKPINVRPHTDVADQFAYLDKPKGSDVPSTIKLAPKPMARAWSPETAAPVGKGIAREPTRLVLSPEEAAQEAQTLKAYKPSAQVQGMKAAARVPAGDLERQMEDMDLSEMEKELLRRSVGSR